jgi:hypothetical protein
VREVLSPDSNWTSYVTEGSEEDGDFTFFGYVCGFEEEWGYFSLSELQAARGPWGLPIERDFVLEALTSQRGCREGRLRDEGRQSESPNCGRTG